MAAPRFLAVVGVAVVTAAGIGLTVSAQPQPPLTREHLLLTVDRMMAERWYGGDERPKLGATKDQEILQRALASTNVEIRRLGVRSLGRFENPRDVPTIAAFLQDRDVGTRCEAINAIVSALHNSEGPDVVPAMRALLMPYQPAGKAPFVPQTCRIDPREAIARLHYDSQTAAEVLRLLTSSPNPSVNPNPAGPGGFRPTVSFDRSEATLILRLILIMLQRDRTLPIDSDLRYWIRLRANPPMNAPGAVVPRGAPPDPNNGRPDLDALEILGLLQETDAAVFSHAALWHCPGLYCGWEIRVAGVKGLNPLDPAAAQALDAARRDDAPEVRVVALRRYASVIGRTGTCEPIATALSDETESMLVRIEAADLLDPRCQERGEVARHLAEIAAELRDPIKADEWRLPSHALETLAKFDPASATLIVDAAAIKHRVWLVRAAAARAAAVIKDEGALLKLVRDADTNVRNEALNGLVMLRYPAVTDLAVESLESADDQLVITGARILKGAKNRDAAIPACLKTLQRLTSEGRDTSRLAKLAVLERLKEWAPQDATGASSITSIVGDLAALRDFDPFVVSRLVEVIELATGRLQPIIPSHRSFQQPTEDELKSENLPDCAKLVLEGGGTLVIGFKMAEAPLTIARFARLVGDGYFNDQPFIYRRRTFETMDAGSIRGNDVSGDARFLRDEIGMERHVIGAVGLATHGRDTGDMRFFVDLWQQPAADYQFTVFGTLSYKAEGPQLLPTASVNGILEGGTINGVFLGYHNNPCR
jgi:cyclophilin family peptidyl-prolyl cis-trans isomerase/HEAT repeat protein